MIRGISSLPIHLAQQSSVAVGALSLQASKRISGELWAMMVALCWERVASHSTVPETAREELELVKS